MRNSQLWSPTPVLVSMFLLSWPFLSAHAQRSKSSESQDSQANRAGPPRV
jgi:hypothetical protein